MTAAPAVIGVPTEAAQHALRVALVNMPWSRIDAPSIQCGLLQSIARQAGHQCDVRYLNLELASVVGEGLYGAIADLTGERMHLLGEWIFSYAAFGDVTSESDYLQEFPEVETIWRLRAGAAVADLVDARRHRLPAWLDEIAARPEWESYDVVGFSSTFLQNTASLALGRRLRERHPLMRIVYGGANVDEPMGAEYMRGLPWVDIVVSGEADVSFPALLNAIANNDDSPIPGVLRQGGAVDPGRQPNACLDDLPVPDYHDYFNQLERLGGEEILGDHRMRLPVEFSRGCWWGAKHHCTFCGLNGVTSPYRSKSSDRAFNELSSLLSEYPCVEVDAVDNIIETGYLDGWCEQLADRHWDIDIFFEVKANLTRPQLRALSRAGVRRIQPGLESMSTQTLRLMRKGCTSLTNIRLLKWARYYGIQVEWNLLVGFPGEVDEGIENQLSLMTTLVHLQPPGGCHRVYLERFSPYFDDPSLGFTKVGPRPVYRHIYPESLRHERIAYFFDYTVSGTHPEVARRRLAKSVAQWSRRHLKDEPSLVYQRNPGRLILVDRRTCDEARTEYTGWQADAYEACGDSPRSFAGLRRQAGLIPEDVTEGEIAEFLNSSCHDRFMVCDDGHYLSVALPQNTGW